MGYALISTFLLACYMALIVYAQGRQRKDDLEDLYSRINSNEQRITYLKREVKRLKKGLPK